MVVNNWKSDFEMTEQSSESLTESLSDQCHIQEINGEPVLLVVYANSDFTAASSDQVSTLIKKDTLYFTIQLSLHYGDCVNILEQVNDDWWWAECNGSHGYVPSNHLVDTPPVQWENEEYFDSYSNLVSITYWYLSLSCPTHPRSGNLQKILIPGYKFMFIIVYHIASYF